jgi:tRNA(Ile)-lysidine synthase TilS/MesJ
MPGMRPVWPMHLGIRSSVKHIRSRPFGRARRMSPEEAAREVRYRFLERAAMAGGFNRIAWATTGTTMPN